MRINGHDAAVDRAQVIPGGLAQTAGVGLALGDFIDGVTDGRSHGQDRKVGIRAKIPAAGITIIMGKSLRAGPSKILGNCPIGVDLTGGRDVEGTVDSLWKRRTQILLLGDVNNFGMMGDHGHLPGFDSFDDLTPVALNNLVHGLDKAFSPELLGHIEDALTDHQRADQLHFVIQDIHHSHPGSSFEGQLPGFGLDEVLTGLLRRNHESVRIGGGRHSGHTRRKRAPNIDQVQAGRRPANEFVFGKERQNGIHIVVLRTAVDRVITRENIPVVDAAHAGVCFIVQLAHGPDHHPQGTGMPATAPRTRQRRVRPG